MLDPRTILTYAAGAALALALAAAGTQTVRLARTQAKFDTYVIAQERAANTQRDDNRERAIEVEERIVTQTVYRDRFITQTVKEIERVTEPLASCPVPADAVRLFNGAARCAREDRPAACGADDAVPSAG